MDGRTDGRTDIFPDHSGHHSLLHLVLPPDAPLQGEEQLKTDTKKREEIGRAKPRCAAGAHGKSRLSARPRPSSSTSGSGLWLATCSGRWRGPANPAGPFRSLPGLGSRWAHSPVMDSVGMALSSRPRWPRTHSASSRFTCEDESWAGTSGSAPGAREACHLVYCFEQSSPRCPWCQECRRRHSSAWGASGSRGQLRGTPRSGRSGGQRNNQYSGRRGRPSRRMRCNKAGREFQRTAQPGVYFHQNKARSLTSGYRGSFSFFTPIRDRWPHTHTHTHTQSLASLPPGRILHG